MPAAHTDLNHIVIAQRYRGPTQSGNGGYVCGVLARMLGGPAEVTLKAPPPLETPLLAAVRDGTVILSHDGVDIATANSTAFQLAAPPALSLREAEAASTRYAGLDAHIYPNCFVCGTHREAGDGLRIFAGPVDDGSAVAAAWSPEAHDAGPSGRIEPEIIWAALDCPSYFGLMSPGLPALLGRMAAHIISQPQVGERCVIVGWRLGQEGRKHFAGSAIYSEAGAILGLAKTTWIELSQSRC